MRKLNSFELRFWNNISIGILIDAGFAVEINNGMITGIGTTNNQEVTMDEIKMRINSGRKHCKCTACGKPIEKENKEFYDMAIGEVLVHLCFDCMDMMFNKTLKATVQYQGKLKSPNKNIRR